MIIKVCFGIEIIKWDKLIKLKDNLFVYVALYTVHTVKYLSVIIHGMNTFGSKEFYPFNPSQFVSMYLLLTLYTKNKLKGHENKKVDPTQQTF